MRMRNKPWARPELEACDYFIREPEQLRDRWNERFAEKQPFYLELGCGKGSFIGQTAYDHPEINYIGVDIKSDMLGVGRRNIVKIFGDRPVKNILLTAYNVEQIEKIISPNDGVERIYINFCNPWGREKHKKRRLTHTRQLEHYKSFLKKGSEIYFKTDDDGLFDESLEYFSESGFEVTYLTRDLHRSEVEYNVETEHEKMFSQEGIPIKYCIAVYSGEKQ